MIRTVAASLILSSLTVAADAQTYQMRAKIAPTIATNTVEPSSPAPAPLTCGIPQKTYWYSGGKQNNLPRTSTAIDAQSACNTFMAANPGMKGVCVWNLQTGASTGPTYVMSGQDATVVRNTGQYRNELYASTCQ